MIDFLPGLAGAEGEGWGHEVCPMIAPEAIAGSAQLAACLLLLYTKNRRHSNHAWHARPVL